MQPIELNNTELDYTQKLSIQSSIVKNAVLFLSGQCDGAVDHDGVGFNGADASFGKTLAKAIGQYGELTPAQEYSAYKMCRKYWRQLRKSSHEIILPKKWLNTYKLDGWQVYNLSKRTGPYTLEWVGEDELSCTCDAYQSGADCGHIKYAQPLLINNQVNQDMSEMVAMVEQLASVDDMLSQVSSGSCTAVEMLPGIFATPGQANALEELMAFSNGSSTIHLLTGYAGTGKTTLVQAWIKRMRESGDNQKIVFTAPTNKATQVIRRMVNTWGLGIECVTCAKLLGLKPAIDRETGKEIFLKSYTDDPKVQEYDLVVVDECSMVNDELWMYLSEEANLCTKFLFMGDPAQLPPVNEVVSQSFTEILNQSNLTEVKRYKGSIAQVADDIRRNLQRRGEPCIISDYTQDGTEGTFVLSRQSWDASIIKAFSSEKYLENPDYCRVLAWTNKRVQGINAMVRSAIRGANAAKFEPGERLIATEHYSQKDGYGGSTTLFYTSSEMEVLEVKEGKQGRWDVYFLTVQIFDDGGKQLLIPVLRDSAFTEFSRTQKELAQKAKSGERHLWDQWHDNKKLFAQVDYAYATTVHKSQGSTFENVFVDVGNILQNKTRNQLELPGQQRQIVYERNQLLYVAFTRPSKRLFIFE